MFELHIPHAKIVEVQAALRTTKTTRWSAVSVPAPSKKLAMAHTEATSKDAVDEGELMPLFGAFCCSTNLLLKEGHGCLGPNPGCSGKAEMTCIKTQCCCQVDGAEPFGCCKNNDENVLVQIGLCCVAIALKRPSTCVKQQSQCCCCVNQMALPPDEEVKAVCALLGVQCYPKFGLCKKNKDLMGGPTSEEMER